MDHPHRLRLTLHERVLQPTALGRLAADPFDDIERSRAVADALGARHATIDASHFWGYQTPAEAAAVLTAFWDSLD